MDEWRTRSAMDLGRAIGAGELDPVDLTESYLDAIAAHPDADQIYSAVTTERAKGEALASRARAQSGTRLGPLDGVPISWKDLVDSAGTPTEGGSRLLKGRTPDRDGAVLTAASLGGSVCLGKTHLTELAFSGLGVNPMTATPPNVNDPTLAPGGSSSGAATSVAFGLAAAAIGSDTGGSVRIPAAWNDLVGLKTTSGRVSLKGVLPLAARFDTIGPLTRTVEDAAEVLALIEGNPAPSLAGTSLSGARLAVLETVAFDGIRDAPAAAFEAAVTTLEAAGAIIARIQVPEVAQAFTDTVMLFPAEAYGTWGETIEAAPDLMYPRVLERFRLGKDILAKDFVRGWHTLDQLRVAYLDATAGFDAVLVPSAPILPPPVDRLLEDEAFFTSENLLALRNTRIGNLMGLCALTLPTATPSCGIMVMGRPFEEERLCRLGAAAERVVRGS
ncbi:MAG: amidase family protein [Pseudomonadota bacterium]